MLDTTWVVAQAGCRLPGSAYTCSWFLQISFCNVLGSPRGTFPHLRWFLRGPYSFPKGKCRKSELFICAHYCRRGEGRVRHREGITSAGCRIERRGIGERCFIACAQQRTGRALAVPVVGFSLHRFRLWGTAPKFFNALLGLTGFTTSSEAPALWEQYVLNISLRFPLQRASFAVGPDGAASQGQTDRQQTDCPDYLPVFCGPWCRATSTV